MATIKDIARETGLGLATISKHINGGNVREKNRIAIENAIDKLGYTVNEFGRSLKTSKSYTVGVVIPELNNIFVTTIITVVGDILRKNGYGVIICDCRTDTKQEREAIRFLMSKRVDGIINMPVSEHGEHLIPVIENDIPIVLLDRVIHEVKNSVSAVVVDNISASAMAVQSLFDVGHKDIGIILGSQNVFTSQQRLLGYNQVLIQNSLQPDHSRIVFSDYSVEGGYKSMMRLLDNKDMTGVFVTNYEMTLGAIIALNEASINIPERISFIGFDNMQMSKVVRPKLTIVTQPLEEIGRHAANILLDKLSGGTADPLPDIITLSADLLPGESVKAI